MEYSVNILKDLDMCIGCVLDKVGREVVLCVILLMGV